MRQDIGRCSLENTLPILAWGLSRARALKRVSKLTPRSTCDQALKRLVHMKGSINDQPVPQLRYKSYVNRGIETETNTETAETEKFQQQIREQKASINGQAPLRAAKSSIASMR